MEQQPQSRVRTLPSDTSEVDITDTLNSQSTIEPPPTLPSQEMQVAITPYWNPSPTRPGLLVPAIRRRRSRRRRPPPHLIGYRSFTASDVEAVAGASFYRDDAADHTERTSACFYILAATLVATLGSLLLAIWWSVSRGDVSGGFAMGAYVATVAGLPIAAGGLFHLPRCKCWSRSARGKLAYLAVMWKKPTLFEMLCDLPS
ncbi:hypothetical protein SUNI508_01541 [Seiridium unicorne]|uniref:Transmembrane protein n=1 Tax=Seiridium unicorne TaxID=138068 RepID=A0ABR2UT08_9PEZI